MISEAWRLGRSELARVETCGEAIDARRATTQRPMAVDKRINVPVLEFLTPLILLGRSSNADAAPAVSARSAPIATVSAFVG